jgi:hypothetical protein
MDKVHKHNCFKCSTPSSEPFRTEIVDVALLVLYPGCRSSGEHHDSRSRVSFHKKSREKPCDRFVVGNYLSKSDVDASPGRSNPGGARRVTGERATFGIHGDCRELSCSVSCGWNRPPITTLYAKPAAVCLSALIGRWRRHETSNKNLTSDLCK